MQTIKCSLDVGMTSNMMGLCVATEVYLRWNFFLFHIRNMIQFTPNVR